MKTRKVHDDPHVFGLSLAPNRNILVHVLNLIIKRIIQLSNIAAYRKVVVTFKMAVQWSSETFVAEFKDLQVCIRTMVSYTIVGTV